MPSEARDRRAASRLGDRLLLFDIDGTLLAGATGAHRAALHHALAQVHEVDAEGVALTLDPAGRTDGEIARSILLAAGIRDPLIDARALEVTRACCLAYAELCDADLSHCVIDGMPDLLEELSARRDVRLSLLTGNFEQIARLKLARAGIGGWFAPGQGAFASDTEDRLEMPPIARRRAGADGLPFPRERALVIGDTPRDIACARADRLACVAVTTGPFTADELRDADVVTGDAGELGAALSGWLEEP
jgi:phosphoglycolate phosphatase-like HAD superfamily hydrolase